MSVRIPVPRAVPAELYIIVTGLLLGACSGPAPSPDTMESESRTNVYYVQLQFTEDKDQAETLLSRGLQWWKQQPDSSRPPLLQEMESSDVPVTIKWKAPFYRVRLGPFAKEKQAETVLKKTRSAFPDAFVVPDRIQNP